jgi:hypothetical protein
MRNTPCECAAAGWCERHQCLKPEAFFQLCRRNQTYFRSWEDGIGPGQSGSDPDSPGTSEMPGLARRTGNFATAIVRHAMSGFQRVDDPQYEARLAICVDCPSCDLSTMVCREKSCGCYLKLKARWQSEECPRGLWTAVLSASDMPAVDGHRPD